MVGLLATSLKNPEREKFILALPSLSVRALSTQEVKFAHWFMPPDCTVSS